MVAQYKKPLADEQRKIEEIERWDHAALRPHRIPTPSCFDHESFEGLQKRLINKVRAYVSEDLQKIRTDDIFGSGLEHVAQQFLASAAQEAVRPSKVPDGELRQVTRYDATGRPFYEFFGSPSSWLKDFAGDKKKID
jgi:hypothetical protein